LKGEEGCGVEGARAGWGRKGREKGIGTGEGKKAFRLIARPSLTTACSDGLTEQHC